ncbi:MAG TPA: RIP metalloprotease RseP [Verrucomicrobiae bacterium]|nr:RIP metalloprotease RseP [Verrucomicrobiae bacterium]
MTILTFIYVAAAVLALFGAAIFVHEFGHFWVARKLGMKVEEFAIGMGPKICSWTRDGIVYSVRWIPAGGFVKLPQMVTAEALEGKTTEDVPPAPPLHRILVAFAGPFMNVVFAFALATIIYFVGLPLPVNPPIIGYVEPGSAEARLGIQEGDVIKAVNNKKVIDWKEIVMNTAVARTSVMPVVIEHAGQEHTYQLQATADNALGLKLLNLDPRDHPQVIQVLSGTPAERAGLQPKDVIISFAGVPVASREQLIDLIRKRGGQATEMRVQRGEKKVTLSVTPAVDPGTKFGQIGVMLGTDSTQVYVVQKPGPLPWQNVGGVLEQTYMVISALVHSHETGVGAKDLAGPVGILTMLAVEVKTDYRLALNFLVLLNINLAIINLLPIPVLDGGHILMAIVEKIRRRPMNVKFVEYVTTAFAVMLISFMLYITVFGDIKRLSFFRAMFDNTAKIEQTPAPAVSNPAPVK